MMKYIRRIALLAMAVLLLMSSAQALTLRYNQRGDEVKALQSAEVKKFIEQTYSGAVVALF